MRRITVEAVDQTSALGFHRALSRFYSELEERDGRWLVSVPLPHDNQTVLTVLDVIQEHVTDRGGDEPALVDLDGHRYRIDT